MRTITNKFGRPETYVAPTGQSFDARISRGLYRLRTKHKLTIRTAAEKCGMIPGTWRKMERRLKAILGSNLDLVCGAFEILPEDLLKLGKPE